MLGNSESGRFGWNYSDFLGKGGSGAVVYKGWNVVSGEAVAVKIYNNAEYSQKRLMTEIDILKKIQDIDHENIVKVLAIEAEASSSRARGVAVSKKTVIVMELCMGGNLLDVLTDPKNSTGLPEDEVRVFISHIYKAIKHLRDLKIAHRDIKPENIMRFVGDDKQIVYKLTDFDSAKELAHDEEYFSLHGTEEFLDPYLYAELITREQNQPSQFQRNKFTASTDLWSIGATLYFSLTGRLPFRPFLGRKDRQTMHVMTMKKDPGVISAYQKTKNGEIVQEKHLPKDTLLSPAFKKLICPLLSKLLEADVSKRMTFEAFFTEIEQLLSKRLVHVFFLNQIEKIRVYLNENTVPALQNELKIWTGVPSKSQVIMFKESCLNNSMESRYPDSDEACLSALPSTTDSKPLIFCNVDDQKILAQPGGVLDCQEPKQFPNQVHRYNDFSIARHNCCVAHQYSRLIEETASKAKLLQVAVTTIHQIVTKQLSTLSWNNLQIISMAESLRVQADMMKKFDDFYKSFSTLIPNDIIEGRQLKNSINNLQKSYSSEVKELQNFDDQLSKLKPSIDQLLDRRVENRQLLTEWNENYEHFPAFKSGLYSLAASSHLKKVCRNFRHMYSPAEVTFPSNIAECSNQEQLNFQVYERIQFTGNLTMLKKQLDDCFSKFSAIPPVSNSKTLVGVFSEWYTFAVVAFVQNGILTKNVGHLKDNLQMCQERMSEAYKKYSVELDRFSNIIDDANKRRINSRQHGIENVKVLRENLFELQNVQQAIRISIKKNKLLCSQLHEALSFHAEN